MFMVMYCKQMVEKRVGKVLDKFKKKMHLPYQKYCEKSLQLLDQNQQLCSKAPVVC